MAQQKMCEAEAEAEAKNWEKRNSEFASRGINQEFDSQQFQLHQASRWADQAQRDKLRSVFITSVNRDSNCTATLVLRGRVTERDFFLNRR